MDRERAEAHLRMLAETELRNAARHCADRARVARVAQVLTAVGALDDQVATQIANDFELAFGARDPNLRRYLGQRPPAWPPGPARPARPSTPGGRVVPLGALVPVRAKGVSGEITLLSFAQPASRGLLTMIVRTCSPGQHDPNTVFSVLDFGATDDRGNHYGIGLHGSGFSGPGEWILRLHPDPPRDLRWLDLSTTPGEPATRVALDGRPPDPPEATVSAAATGPGEHFLNALAMRLLAAAGAYPRHMPLNMAGLTFGLAMDGLGDVVTALQACEAISPLSPLPAQLAALCAHLDIRNHGITTPPADSLPDPWRSVLLQFHRGHQAEPARSAATAVALPEVDGIRLTVLGLHDTGDRTVLFMHARGPDVDRWDEQDRWPVIWIRDSAGWWHATRAGGSADEDREVTMDLPVVPPLSRDADWIEVIAAGRSVEVRATLPVRWQ